MNAAFDAADNAGKRVIIARDVIAALAEKRLVPMSGTYLSLPSERSPHGTYGDGALDMLKAKGVDLDGSFQDLLPTLPPCQVCAKGAIFACVVSRRNQVTTRDAFRSPARWDGQGMFKMLGGIFDAEQLSLIEREFEGHAQDSGIPDDSVMGLFDEEDEDGNRKPLYNDEQRMTLIMQNIIVNRGTFVPEDGVR